jgi:hypothetical protein
MNISSTKTISGFREYESKIKKTKDFKKTQKPDTLEISNIVPLDRWQSYLDDSFLDDPQFDKQFEAMITKILNN